MSAEAGLKEIASFLTRHIGFWALIGSLFLTCLTLLAIFSLPNYSPILWPEGNTTKQLTIVVLILTFWLLALGSILYLIGSIRKILNIFCIFRMTKKKIESLPSTEKQILRTFVSRYYEPQIFDYNSPAIKSLKHKGLIDSVHVPIYRIGDTRSLYKLSDSAKVVLETHPELVQ